MAKNRLCLHCRQRLPDLPIGDMQGHFPASCARCERIILNATDHIVNKMGEERERHAQAMADLTVRQDRIIANTVEHLMSLRVTMADS